MSSVRLDSALTHNVQKGNMRGSYLVNIYSDVAKIHDLHIQYEDFNNQGQFVTSAQTFRLIVVPSNPASLSVDPSSLSACKAGDTKAVLLSASDKFGNKIPDVRQNAIALQVSPEFASAPEVSVDEDVITLKTKCLHPGSASVTAAFPIKAGSTVETPRFEVGFGDIDADQSMARLVENNESHRALSAPVSAGSTVRFEFTIFDDQGNNIQIDLDDPLLSLDNFEVRSTNGVEITDLSGSIRVSGKHYFVEQTLIRAGNTVFSAYYRQKKINSDVRQVVVNALEADFAGTSIQYLSAGRFEDYQSNFKQDKGDEFRLRVLLFDQFGNQRFAVPESWGQSKCGAPSGERVECGFVGIKEDECLSKGCCWNPLQENSAEPWCHRPASDADLRAFITGPETAEERRLELCWTKFTIEFCAPDALLPADQQTLSPVLAPIEDRWERLIAQRTYTLSVVNRDQKKQFTFELTGAPSDPLASNLPLVVANCVVLPKENMLVVAGEAVSL